MMCCFCNFSYVSWHFNDLQCQALRPGHILAVGMAKVRKVRDLGEVEVVPLLHGAHSTEKSYSQNIHPCHGDPRDPQEFTIPQSSTFINPFGSIWGEIIIPSRGIPNCFRPPKNGYLWLFLLDARRRRRRQKVPERVQELPRCEPWRWKTTCNGKILKTPHGS